MLAEAKEGDVIYVHDFSRLARSTKDLLEIVEDLNSRGIHVVSNKENIDTNTNSGKLMLTMFAAIYEFERTNMLEIPFCRYMGYRLVKVIETSNFFLIVNMARYRTKAIILCDGRNIVLSIVLPDSTKTPLEPAGNSCTIDQRLLYYLIYCGAYPNI